MWLRQGSDRHHCADSLLIRICEPGRNGLAVRREDPQALPLETATCQAKAPAASHVSSITAESMDSIRLPAENATRISSSVTRRGPQSPGWWSLKHSM